MATVLIVDDDIRILKSTTRLLKGFKFQCDTATNPFTHDILRHDCLQEYLCKDYVAIISDLRLGLGSDKTGLDFLKSFQRSTCINKDRIKLILCSGQIPINVAVDALRFGIKVLNKPFDPDELIKAIGVIP